MRKRHLGFDDRDRLGDLVRSVERVDRARALAFVRAPPAFFAVARDRDRFVTVVGAPRAFFAVPDRFFVARGRDFEVGRFRPPERPLRDAALAGLSEGNCEGRDAPPPNGIPFEPADRTSRRSSRPAATAPSIMLARSSCLQATRALAAA
jgi:hypothetical protein